MSTPTHHYSAQDRADYSGRTYPTGHVSTPAHTALSAQDRADLLALYGDRYRPINPARELVMAFIINRQAANKARDAFKAEPTAANLTAWVDAENLCKGDD